MILGKIRGKRRTILAVGLSGENVTRLAAGEPILTQLEELGFSDLDLVVFYGRTEADAQTQLDTLVERVRSR